MLELVAGLTVLAILAALVLAAIVLVSLGLRLAHLAEIEKDMLYQYALLDESYYWDAARHLIDKGEVEDVGVQVFDPDEVYGK